jgi:pimeloyl-ACP methyl ester carboxylesterase
MAYATVNGIRLYYEWHGAGRGLPVVLVMGLGGDSTAWPLQLAALAPHHRVLVFDNRGAGQSDAPDVAYTTRGMAQDLLALLDALDVERAHLLGLSLGGAIAQEAAVAAPSRFASLQLHSTWAGPHPYFHALVNAVRAVRLQLDRESFYRALSVWLFTPRCFVTQPELIETVVLAATHHQHPVAAHAYLRQTDAALGHDARERLHLIRCPTLVGVGSQDLITPPFLAAELANGIPGARLQTFPDTGHGGLWEEPETFNRACLDFLDGAPDLTASKTPKN